MPTVSVNLKLTPYQYEALKDALAMSLEHMDNKIQYIKDEIIGEGPSEEGDEALTAVYQQYQAIEALKRFISS